MPAALVGGGGEVEGGGGERAGGGGEGEGGGEGLADCLAAAGGEAERRTRDTMVRRRAG